MREAWIRLANLQLPARLANALLERFGSVESVLNASPSQLEDVSGMTNWQTTRILDRSFCPTDAQIEFLESRAVKLLTQDGPDYPPN